MWKPQKAGALACALCLAAPAGAAPVISELFYDASGSDAGVTFLELYGAPGTSLEGLVIEAVNGGDGSPYRSIGLSGSLPGDGVFLIGDDAGGGISHVPGVDLVADIDLQNGPDSVRLLDASGRVLDALGYGDFGGGALFAGEGLPAPDAPAGSSLARPDPRIDRDDNSLDFVVLDAPTPGVVPSPGAVPLPGAVWLMGSGLAGLVAVGRRRQAEAAPAG